MTDRPILMSTPMVLATLREVEAPGTGKTQTRRILKDAPTEPGWILYREADGRMKWVGPNGYPSMPCVLRFAVGDRLWVRETLCIHNGFGKPLAFGPQVREGDNARIWSYAADNVESETISRRIPAIHMPRAYSRLTLTVTDVRVQRLQEISEEDCGAEGITKSPDGDWYSAAPETRDPALAGYSRRGAFYGLWSKINGGESWDANPWIVAVTFRPELRNIDQEPT